MLMYWSYRIASYLRDLNNVGSENLKITFQSAQNHVYAGIVSVLITLVVNTYFVCRGTPGKHS